MMPTARNLLREADGATAVEYALMCAMLVLAVAATLPTFGLTLRDVYLRISSAFS
jgi:Flp pilus assembly pilin Flp